MVAAAKAKRISRYGSVEESKLRFTQRGHQRREALLDATFEIIVRDGLGAVSLRTVVAEAGASHGAVKYYFKSRAELIEETMRRVASHGIDSLARTFKEVIPNTKGHRSVAAVIARHSTREMIEDRMRGIVIIELHLAAARDERLRPILKTWGRAFADIISDTLAGLGSSRPTKDAAILTSMISGLVITQLALPRRNFENDILAPSIARFLHEMIVNSRSVD